MNRRPIQRILLFSLLWLIVAATKASPDFLIDTDWLSEHIDDDKLILLEVRYHPHRYYTVGHIPGAVQVQRFKDLGDNGGTPLMRFPTRTAFQKTLRSWGIDDDSTIVIYDDSSTALSSRLYFLLELYGFDISRVKILNGGTLEWSAFEEMEREPAAAGTGTVTLKPANPRMFIEWTTVYDDVVSRRDPDVTLLDARPHDMYTGEVIKHAIMGGHIPGAINIVSLEGTEGQKWISDQALARMYQEIPKDKTIYAYCHDGFRMSLAYLQLKSLGYQNVRLYNGGWSHWGNRLTLPVVEGDKPYAGDYEL